MHMWMWFGYDLGEFMFPGLNINTRWSFAILWILLFFSGVLFEASKVYLLRVQRAAYQCMVRHRCDEGRNLLAGECQYSGEPTTSRNTSAGQMDRWTSFRAKVMVNIHQSVVFVLHNVAGYLLMLAVMVYNVHLLLAVIFGMMLGYFLFGTKLTLLQMRCFKSRRRVVCTPECDDTAQGTTPPRLDSSTESDFFMCQTRTCIQPSHYFRASNPQEGTSGDSSGELINATCYYGAKACPSKVAQAKRVQETPQTCHHGIEKEESPSVEDRSLLQSHQGCCKEKPEPPAAEEKKCCKSSKVDVSVVIHEPKSCCEDKRYEIESDHNREDTPQSMCCHKTKSTDSQEHIVT